MNPRTILQLAHILVLGPLLIAIGLGYLDAWSMAIAALGSFITLYHAYLGYTKWTLGQSFWVNLIHVIYVGPTLVIKGLVEPTPRYMNEVLIMFGFAAIGYHAFNLVTAR